MKILFYCTSFYPVTGGLETVALLLARGLAETGIEIKLITLTPLGNRTELDENFEIIRMPGGIRLLKLVSWCTIFFQHSISLKGIWPLILIQRKWIVLHHFSYYHIDGSITFLEQVKRTISLLAVNISCSDFVNSTLAKHGKVILNPYEDRIFYQCDEIAKNKELLFAGRLVPDKGCELLVESIHLLKEKYQELVSLTIVGDGPQFSQIQQLICYYKLQNKIEMTGILSANDLAHEMRIHKAIVVPSVSKEPFGLVALEGLACGCIPIISANGGLYEASGGFGLPFHPDNSDELCEQILLALKHPEYCIPPPDELSEFLEKRTYKNVSGQYFEFLKTQENESRNNP